MKTFIAILVVALIAIGGYFLVTGTTFPPADNNDNNGQATTTPTPTLLTYNSTTTDVTFRYPNTYRVEERTDEFEGEDIRVVTLIDRNAVIPDMSEGPPVISLLVIPNADNEALDAWIKSNTISNFNLSLDERLSSTTVDGIAGLSYTHSGLYETDATAVEYEDTIYLFSAGWHDANAEIRTDFQNLLKTVQFE